MSNRKSSVPSPDKLFGDSKPSQHQDGMHAQHQDSKTASVGKKMTIYLPEEIILQLDKIELQAREKSGVNNSRSKVIEKFVVAVMEDKDYAITLLS